MESFSSMSGSSRKARAIAGGSQIVSCLVDGCESELSKGRDYHRRHKVCEKHSKSPEVRIGGQEQRFCQQCSRFHSLVEFDEGKRSCRKRLEGHNRRRRKPKADVKPRSSGGGGGSSSSSSASSTWWCGGGGGGEESNNPLSSRRFPFLLGSGSGGAPSLLSSDQGVGGFHYNNQAQLQQQQHHHHHHHHQASHFLSTEGSSSPNTASFLWE